MKLRALLHSDKAILDKWAKASGYPYIEIEDAVVIADDDGNPIMACAPRTLVELYLWADPQQHPAAKLHALRMLHEKMAPWIKAQGYSEVNAFLPPEIERKFGRRLMRTFGWVRNWVSYCKIL